VIKNLYRLLRTTWFGLILAVLVAGALVSWATAYHTDRKMRAELLEKARIISRMVNTENVGRLSGSEADLKSADYLRLKMRLLEVRQATARCRFVYLLGRDSDGRILFYVDSEPAGSKDESPPGQFYDEASAGFHRVFSTGLAEVEGPAKDRWGTWVSAIVPIFDVKSNETIALGMDIDAKDWRITIAGRTAIPAGLTVVVLVVVVSIFCGRQCSSGVPDNKPVLKRLALPLAAALLILVSGFGIALLWQYNRHLNELVSSDIAAIPKDFSQVLKLQSDGMGIALQSVISDGETLTALKASNRERLLSLYDKQFNMMRGKYGITHLYFHSPDLVNILRVHKPDKYGDIIERFTACEAQRTGKTVSGIELGPLGMFTLRIVSPVYNDGELIGFAEIGKEIEDLLTVIQRNDLIDIAVTVFKEKLNRQEWEAGMAMLSRKVDWDRFPNAVLTYSSLPQLPVELAPYVQNACNINSDAKLELAIGGATNRVAFLPLNDVSGSLVGHLIVMYDISGKKAEFSRFLLLFGIVILLLFSLIFSFIYVILSRTDKGIEAHGRILRESEERLKTVLNAAQDGIIMLNPEGNISMWNASAERIFGYTDDQILGQNLHKLAPDNFHRDHRRTFGAFRRSKEGQVVELTARRKNNEEFPAELSFSVVQLQDGWHSIVVVRDITERKRAEAAIRQSEERLKTVVHAAQDAIIMLKPDGKISMWNDSAERIFGYTVDEALHQNLHKILAPQRFHEDHGKAFAEFRRSGQGKAVGQLIELAALRKNGEEFPIELSLSAVQMQDGWHSIGVVRDITERKRVEERLQQAIAESARFYKDLEKSMAKETELAARADAANKAKSQFLANMSHEIRTPMNAIIGFSELLAEDDLTDEQIKNVNIIREAGHNLLKLINDILDLSKIEAGKLNVEIANCALDKMLISVESLMGLKAKEKGLEFKVIYGGDLPAQIRTDSSRLHQCLVNLIGNAVKFTQKGHIYLAVSLETGGEKPRIRFDVEDTGIGIPPEKQKLVFEAFEQADGSHTRKYGGTGLGLSITKQLAELLGGKITLASEVGRGSVFSLLIPAGVDVTKQHLLSRHNISCVTHLQDNKKSRVEYAGSVLVAEDAPTNQALIKALLGRLGLNVTIASDGIEAVQKATTGSFDLIFMDMQMPNMNGYEATRALREKGIKTPIIALTANVVKGDDQRCIEAGCDAYLPKPIDRSELKMVIAKYLPAQKKDSAENIESSEKQWADTGLAADNQSVISWAAIIEQCGEEEVVREVVEVFLKEAPKYMEMLSEAIKNKDSKDIRFYAHKLKGSSSYVTAKQLVEKAQQLELAGMKQDMDVAGSLFEQVREEFTKVISFLSQPDWDKKAKQQVNNVEEKQTC
jgi:PAS domain S-box-containing protein